MHHSYKTHSNHSIQILYSAEWNYLNTWQIGDHKRRNVQWNLWQFIFSLCFKIWSMFIIASSLPTRFEWIPAAGLLNCSIFVPLDLKMLRIQQNRWISVTIWLITQFVQIPCQICLTSDLWAFSHVDPASTMSSTHWAMVHDLIILSGNYFQYWKKCSQTTRAALAWKSLVVESFFFAYFFGEKTEKLYLLLCFLYFPTCIWGQRQMQGRLQPKPTYNCEMTQFI